MESLQKVGTRLVGLGLRARLSHFVCVVHQGAGVGHFLAGDQKVGHMGEIRHQQPLRGQIHSFARIQCCLHVLSYDADRTEIRVGICPNHGYGTEVCAGNGHFVKHNIAAASLLTAPLGTNFHSHLRSLFIATFVLAGIRYTVHRRGRIDKGAIFHPFLITSSHRAADLGFRSYGEWRCISRWCLPFLCEYKFGPPRRSTRKSACETELNADHHLDPFAKCRVFFQKKRG